MHDTLLIASPKPLNPEEWNDLLDWEDYEIAEAIDGADYADLVTGGNIRADDLKFFQYLTIEDKDENNLLVTISEENRQKCRNWKAKAYRRYADDIETGDRYSDSWRDVDAIENDVDFFLPTYDSLDIYSEYSDNLPDKFYICRKMYYDYHI
ncbi:MAG: hypothetical protein ACI4CC_01490 [Lachnospiraceae bacterium]